MRSKMESPMTTRSGKISVNNGVALVETSIYRWQLLGATCPTTLRVGAPATDQSFKFFPNKKGTGKGDLVFMRGSYSHDTQYGVLFHITHKNDGFVLVKEAPENVIDTVGADVNYQVIGQTIELQVGATRFTSDAATTAAPDESVMIADASDILKYIAGHIKLNALKAAAKRAQKYISLRQDLKNCKADRDTAQVECQQKDRQIQRLNAELADMRGQLAAMAEQG